jgi:CheY-specific phosphatase CheX
MKISREKVSQTLSGSLTQILKSLFGARFTEGSVRLMDKPPVQQKKEIIVLIQFVGGLEGKIIFCCSDESAIAISRILMKMPEGKEIESGEKHDIIKSSLGELMNMLAGKLSFVFQQDFGTIRITTPALVYGDSLEVAIYDENAYNFYFESQFGYFEINFSAY